MGYGQYLELPFGPGVNEVLCLNSPNILKLHKGAGLSLPELEKADLGSALCSAVPPTGTKDANCSQPAMPKTLARTLENIARRENSDRDANVPFGDTRAAQV